MSWEFFGYLVDPTGDGAMVLMFVPPAHSYVEIQTPKGDGIAQ